MQAALPNPICILPLPPLIIASLPLPASYYTSAFVHSQDAKIRMRKEGTEDENELYSP